VTTRDRLQRGAAVLETLEYCRVKTRQPKLGSTVDKKIIDDELNHLEASTELEDVDNRYGLHSGTTGSA
jgi:hypothetical protein